MSRPARIPDRGDVTAGAVAQRLGLALSELERLRPELEARNFPAPDPTTGRYCIDAVDRWRLRR
jgi:DNA-binding IclR family transcriptional regulator